jgi:hypothetical protein
MDPRANPKRRGVRGFCMAGRDQSKALWESQLRWGPKESRQHEFQKVYVATVVTPPYITCSLHPGSFLTALGGVG